MPVSSEVQQDFFLSCIGKGLFGSDHEDSSEEASDDCTETEFRINLPENYPFNLPISIIRLEHRLSTAVELVGLQVWRGALLLGDLLLTRPHLVQGKNVLELASGTGLTALVAAIFASNVVATDVNRDEILTVLRRNGSINKRLQPTGEKSNYSVTELDFFWDSWPSDVTQIVQKSDVILAADVVYNKEITKHFFKTLAKIMKYSPKVAYIAIEKRQRVGDGGSVIAPNFDYFLENIYDLEKLPFKIKVKKLETDFARCFSYTRVNELTLWLVESY